MTDYDPGEFVMPFGRYTGQTLMDIGATARGCQYLDWLVAKLNEQPGKHHDVRAALTDYMAGEEHGQAAEADWPTIEDAKDLAGRYRKRGVIVLSFSDGGMHSCGWGWQRTACDAMRKIGKQIIEMIGDGRIEP
ncbi:MAG TPA: hypothetical protein VM223_14725 [Planctomycetota bacterium]|nr:hypothetical protein [Planctomycetota bacterium]